jgi:hypothetical protein
MSERGGPGGDLVGVGQGISWAPAVEEAAADPVGDATAADGLADNGEGEGETQGVELAEALGEAVAAADGIGCTPP